MIFDKKRFFLLFYFFGIFLELIIDYTRSQRKKILTDRKGHNLITI
jgi:hypothetical protein